MSALWAGSSEAKVEVWHSTLGTAQPLTRSQEYIGIARRVFWAFASGTSAYHLFHPPQSLDPVDPPLSDQLLPAPRDA